jgi:hypothetical protein
MSSPEDTLSSPLTPERVVHVKAETIAKRDNSVEQNRPSASDSDCLCGLVVRVPGYRTQMYCDSCEVRTEFIYVM